MAEINMMLFNPFSNRLQTTERKLIKQLSCSESINWDELEAASVLGARNCDHCKKRVQDIKNMTAGEVLTLVENDPQACLKLELNYDNIRMVTDDA